LNVAQFSGVLTTRWNGCFAALQLLAFFGLTVFTFLKNGQPNKLKRHEENHRVVKLGGGFKDFLFLPLVGEDFQFD